MATVKKLQVTESCGNVFVDIGLPEKHLAVAMVMVAKGIRSGRSMRHEEARLAAGIRHHAIEWLMKRGTVKGKRKRGLVALLKSMKPLKEDFPEIDDPATKKRKIPNAKTVAAMEEARRGNLKGFATVEELLAHLKADDIDASKKRRAKRKRASKGKE